MAARGAVAGGAAHGRRYIRSASARNSLRLELQIVIIRFADQQNTLQSSNGEPTVGYLLAAGRAEHAEGVAITSGFRGTSDLEGCAGSTEHDAIGPTASFQDLILRPSVNLVGLISFSICILVRP